MYLHSNRIVHRNINVHTIRIAAPAVAGVNAAEIAAINNQPSTLNMKGQTQNNTNTTDYTSTSSPTYPIQLSHFQHSEALFVAHQLRFHMQNESTAGVAFSTKDSSGSIDDFNLDMRRVLAIDMHAFGNLLETLFVKLHTNDRMVNNWHKRGFVISDRLRYTIHTLLHTSIHPHHTTIPTNSNTPTKHSIFD